MHKDVGMNVRRIGVLLEQSRTLDKQLLEATIRQLLAA